MIDTNKPETTEKAKKPPRDRRVFASLEEAQNSGHSNMGDKGWAVFVVMTPAGKQFFTVAPSHAEAIVNAARHDGYGASTAGKVPTKDKVAGMLAQLSPEDRAALLTQFAGKKGK